jgi:hypothetical protein
MKNTHRGSAALLALVLLLALDPAPTSAAEGKWTPEQVLQLDPAWLRELGLELPPQELWSTQGAGLLEAAISIGGCSAAFISADGLVATNHHCAFGLLQQSSSPERDLITAGFLATSQGDELPGEGTRALLPHKTRDVTAEVEAAVPKPSGTRDADDLARFRAIERKSSQLVATCEKQPHRRCQVAAFDGGVQYTLIEGVEFPDVRVVYAPPRAVGEFGGEVDNWSWPRHVGDFALLRVWAAADGGPAEPGKGTRPYRPRHFFPVSSDGVAPDQFVMVPGYPGRTFRAETGAEMKQRAERWFPDRAALFRAWIDLMEAGAKGGDAARIALASRIKSLANSEKNARGQLAGVARGNLLAKKEAAESEVLAWIAEHREHAPAAGAHREIAELVARLDATWERDFLLGQVRNGPLDLDLALTLVRWAKERQKPDAARDPAYMERNRDRLADGERIGQKRLDRPTEETLLADWLARASALPAASRVVAVDTLLAGKSDRDAIARAVAALHATTRVFDLDARTLMFEETPAQLRARHDPLLDFAFALDEDLLALKSRDDAKAGALSRLRPVWRRAVMAQAGKPIAPDANGTLRITFAHVEGYAPRDGVFMTPQTTVAGVVAKHTGEQPFTAPPFVLAAAPAAPRSRWVDPRLRDVPVDFLADADTTGGNSGSPVLDGRGRLVGLNFDRVWENVANDFGYAPEVARNISVDVRYLLWALEVEHGEDATPLLREMGACCVGAVSSSPAETGAPSPVRPSAR